MRKDVTCLWYSVSKPNEKGRERETEVEGKKEDNLKNLVLLKKSERIARKRKRVMKHQLSRKPQTRSIPFFIIVRILKGQIPFPRIKRFHFHFT